MYTSQIICVVTRGDVIPNWMNTHTVTPLVAGEGRLLLHAVAFMFLCYAVSAFSAGSSGKTERKPAY